MRNRRVDLCAVFITGLLMAAWATPADAQWQIDSKDGRTNIRIGFLAQPQIEAIETPDTTATSTNLFLRRFRLLLGGRIADRWTFFFDTDSPNLGKANPDRAANPTGAKDAGTIFMQDVIVTYDRANAFKIDAGMLLLGQSHNHLQAATTLLPVDFGPYSYVQSTPMGERVGRDYGIQVRGYPAGQHIEYRLGVFQGVRGVEARNGLRVIGRGVWYPFSPEPGFFYAGTFQGSRRVVGVGGSFDRQEDFSIYGVDVFAEESINKGEQGVTAQFDYNQIDGGTLVPALAKQKTYLVEAAFHFARGKWSPFVQYNARNFENPLTADQYSMQVGLAYWMAGHNRSIKFGAGRLHTDHQPDQTQVLLQLQVLYY